MEKPTELPKPYSDLDLQCARAAIRAISASGKLSYRSMAEEISDWSKRALTKKRPLKLTHCGRTLEMGAPQTIAENRLNQFALDHSKPNEEVVLAILCWLISEQPAIFSEITYKIATPAHEVFVDSVSTILAQQRNFPTVEAITKFAGVYEFHRPFFRNRTDEIIISKLTIGEMAGGLFDISLENRFDDYDQHGRPEHEILEGKFVPVGKEFGFAFLRFSEDRFFTLTIDKPTIRKTGDVGAFEGIITILASTAPGVSYRFYAVKTDAPFECKVINVALSYHEFTSRIFRDPRDEKS